jgi:hypothetical protein
VYAGIGSPTSVRADATSVAGSCVAVVETEDVDDLAAVAVFVGVTDWVSCFAHATPRRRAQSAARVDFIFVVTVFEV